MLFDVYFWVVDKSHEDLIAVCVRYGCMVYDGRVWCVTGAGGIHMFMWWLGCIDGGILRYPLEAGIRYHSLLCIIIDK